MWRTERDQFPSPMVRAATVFHGDLGRWQLLRKGGHLRAAEIDSQHRLILLIDAVEGEDGFERVDTNALILGHGRRRSWLLTAPILARDAMGPSIPTNFSGRHAIPKDLTRFILPANRTVVLDSVVHGSVCGERDRPDVGDIAASRASRLRHAVQAEPGLPPCTPPFRGSSARSPTGRPMKPACASVAV